MSAATITPSTAAAPALAVAASAAATAIINRHAVKRSLSESSAEGYHRSDSAVKSNGRVGSALRKMWSNELVMNARSTRAQPQRIRKHSDARDFNDNRSDGVVRGRKRISDAIDVGIRMALVVIFIKLELTNSFKRKIHMEEMWLYKNPRMPDIVSPQLLILAVILGPFATTLLHLALTRDNRDFRAASWVWTLVLGLNGLVTSLLKISIGRPRPDFFYRCFPDGIMVLNNVTDATNHGAFDLFNCSGSLHDINEGCKSFPSGHSSFAFASFGFIALYVGAKLHAFNPHARGQTWRLCVTLAPLLLAAMIAVSRYCDYHHHWQDVVVGSVIGICVAYCVYRQYYPPLSVRHCHRPLPRGASPRSLGVLYRRMSSDERTDLADEAPGAQPCGGEDEFETNATNNEAERSPLIGKENGSTKWF